MATRSWCAEQSPLCEWSQVGEYLNEIGATHNRKGDNLKKHSCDIYDAAEYIVGLGKIKCKN